MPTSAMRPTSSRKRSQRSNGAKEPGLLGDDLVHFLLVVHGALPDGAGVVGTSEAGHRSINSRIGELLDFCVMGEDEFQHRCRQKQNEDTPRLAEQPADALPAAFGGVLTPQLPPDLFLTASRLKSVGVGISAQYQFHASKCAFIMPRAGQG